MWRLSLGQVAMCVMAAGAAVGAAVPAVASPRQTPAAVATAIRLVPVGFTVDALVSTKESVLARGTVAGGGVIARLDPESLRVLAKSYLPVVGQLAAGRGRVLVAVPGARPALVVLRERDLAVITRVPLPQQPSGGADVAAVGDIAVVGLRAGAVAVDLRSAHVVRSARLEGTNVQVAQARGTVVAVGSDPTNYGYGTTPLLLNPRTLAVLRRIPTVLTHVLGMTSRDDTVWITTAAATFGAGVPVQTSGPPRLQHAVGNQIPHDVRYVAGEHTVRASAFGVSCFDRRTGQFLGYSPGPADFSEPVAEAHRLLTPDGTNVSVWTPTGPCSTP